jgi:hypothetical protein
MTFALFFLSIFVALPMILVRLPKGGIKATLLAALKLIRNFVFAGFVLDVTILISVGIHLYN